MTGDLSECKNYRGITQHSVLGKVFNSIVEPDERFSRYSTSCQYILKVKNLSNLPLQ